MNSSHPQSRKRGPYASPEKTSATFSVTGSEISAKSDSDYLPGSMNDGTSVRLIVAESLKNCRLSRTEVAERMTYLTGTEVTERSLNNFSAESRGDYRFPAELDRAFCSAVGDNRLLVFRAQLAGLHLVDEASLDLMELGRQYLIERRASAMKASLESKLAGVNLG